MAMFLTVATAMAVPAKRGVKKTLTLKDGTRVEATLKGDEFVNYYQTEDGRAIQQLDGAYQVVDREALVKEHTRLMSTRNKQRAARRVGSAPEGGYKGQKKGLVILVQFTDVKFTYTMEQFDAFFNQSGFDLCGMSGSVHDYFHAQSYGEFDLDFDVVGPVTMSHTASYYASSTDKKRVPDLVYDACKKVDSNVNFKTYDWDKDGVVDQVYVIYAGYGAAQGAENTIWPHEWSLSAGTNGTYMTGERNVVSTYGISNELRGNGKSNTGILDGIGTACHEFSHCLGLPDFYDTRDNGTNFGMNVWSLMDYGCYNDNGCTPSGYTAYERWYSGWLEPTELSGSRQIVDMPAIEEQPVAYIVYNDNYKNEYYMLANHQQTGFDKAQYGHGLLVLHADYSADAWTQNVVNNDPEHQRMTIIAADNNYDDTYDYDLAGDLFPGSGNNDALTDESTPAATLYNDNTDGRKYMGKPITDIMEAEGLITFNFMGGVHVDSPIVAEATNITETSFTANWNAVSGAQEYTVILTKTMKPSNNPYDNVIFSEDFKNFKSEVSSTRTDISDRLDEFTELSGWTGSKLYRSPYLLRVGNNSEEGDLVSPVFEQPSQDALTVVVTPTGISNSTGTLELRIILASTGEYANATLSDIPSATDSPYSYLLSANWTYGDFQVGIHSSTPGVCMQGLMALDGIYTWDDFSVKSESMALVRQNGNQSHKIVLSEDDFAWYSPEGKRIARPRKVNKSEVSTYRTTATHYDFVDLTPAVYSYRVRVTTSEGVSAWSDEATVDLTTGINEIKSEESGMKNDGAVYDLAGRQIVTYSNRPMQRGIYIQGGKKILVK